MINQKVSVVLPVYNGGKFLSGCLNDLLNQSYKNIEILVIDDGSTDNTTKICNRYKKLDKRIVLIKQNNNGVASARNKGIIKAKGIYLCFVDVDDRLPIEGIEVMVKGMTGDVDFVMSDFEIYKSGKLVAENRYLINTGKIMNTNEIISKVYEYLNKPTGYSLFNYVWGKLYRTKTILDNNIRYNENLRVFEDILFIFRYLRYSDSIRYVHHHVYKYITGTSLQIVNMDIYFSNPIAYKQALMDIKEYLLENGEDTDKVDSSIGNACIYFTIRIIMRIFGKNANVDNFKIHKFISVIVEDKWIRENLKYYCPKKSDSKIFPKLIELKLVWLIILVGKIKSINK